MLLEIHNTSRLHAHFPPQGTFDMISGWLMTMRDGKILDIREYPDGIYGVDILAQFFPVTTSSTAPTNIFGELPSYALPQGSCMSCGKIHQHEIAPFLDEH